MDSLFKLQFVCCIAFTMMATVLGCSGFLIRKRRRRYEVSRWTLCVSMFLLAIHYLLQMRHGLRASGDDVGSVVNVLFYSPVVLLFFYAVYNVHCSRKNRWLYIWCGVAFYILIVAAFLVGKAQAHSMHIGKWLYVMLALFVVGTLAAIVVNARVVIARRKALETQTGIDMAIYDRFATSCFFVISGFTILLPIAMIYRALLYVVGPVLILAMFIFVLCFIALGYDADTISDMAEVLDAEDGSGLLSDERVAEIESALEVWRRSGGFRYSMASVFTVADAIGVPHAELSMYFRNVVRATFRIWLSDVRFGAAKQMLMEKRIYSIDTIASECGFTSPMQMYRVFKTNTGMSPEQWRNSLS